MRYARSFSWLIVFLPALFADPAAAQIVTRVFPSSDPSINCSSIDINNRQEVLVNCWNGTFFIWTLDDNAVTQLAPGGYQAINDLGQLLGFDEMGRFIRSADGSVRRLDGSFSAERLNDLGDVSSYQGIALTDGTYVPPPTGFRSFSALNNQPQLLISDGSDGYFSPLILWSHATGAFSAPIPAASRPVLKAVRKAPFEINDRGDIVTDWGDIFMSGSVEWLSLSRPVGWESQYPFIEDMNMLGQVVGAVYLPEMMDSERAVFWKTPAEPIILSIEPGWAYATNALSQVAGETWYVDPEGRYRNAAVVWELAPPTPPTPVERIDAVHNQLTSFVSSGDVTEDDAQGLMVKLTAAKKTLEKSDVPAAKKILTACLNQVSALTKSHRLTETAAASIKTLVQRAIDSLS